MNHIVDRLYVLNIQREFLVTFFIKLIWEFRFLPMLIQKMREKNNELRSSSKQSNLLSFEDR